MYLTIEASVGALQSSIGASLIFYRPESLGEIRELPTRNRAVGTKISDPSAPRDVARIFNLSVSVKVIPERDEFFHAARARVSFCVSASWAATKAVRAVRPDSVI